MTRHTWINLTVWEMVTSSSMFLRCVCMCCFVLFHRYWGIVTVPGFHHERTQGGAPTTENSPTTLHTLSPLEWPGLPGVSYSTLTTSLTVPIPSLNGRTLWAGPKFVRPHTSGSWVMVRFLQIQSLIYNEILDPPLPKQSHTFFFPFHLFVSKNFFPMVMTDTQYRE